REDPVRSISVIASTRIRVRYKDTDCMKVVYYGNYLTYFEVGRVELLRQQGLAMSHVDTQVHLPVVEAVVRFRKPARLDDLLTVRLDAALAARMVRRAPRQLVGVLGPNGAGKSTTMRILACFMPASSGAARVAGYDVFRQSMEVRQRIGYLPENVPLYTDMRVAAYLDFVAEVKGVGRTERRRRVADVMDRCMVSDVQ